MSVENNQNVAELESLDTPEVDQVEETLAPAPRFPSVVPTGFGAQLTSALKGPANWHLTRWAGLLPQFEMYGNQYQAKNESELLKESLSLRYRAKSGEKLDSLVPQAFALVREAATRTLAMRHFDVQMLGGISLFHGSIAEMETGEGKTLTATLPMYVRALIGKGTQLATVNDYLAARDAQWMAPVYQMLGLTVGVIQTNMSRPQRRQMYACDITYGTAKEFGFDFLRDRLVLRRIRQEMIAIFSDANNPGESPVQREPYFALVDEADSVLIDDARTPLIISAISDKERTEEQATYMWAAKYSPQFEMDEHYKYDHEKKKVELHPRGRQFVRSLPRPPEMDDVGLIDCYDFIERSIKVNREFHRDQHYVINDDGEIVIVDESTGRLAEGRKWRDGIHQSVEAKEGVQITVDTGQAARITVQDFFLRYRNLAGMTGTASTSAREFRKIYKSRVVCVPTNRPKKRQRLPDRVFGNGEEKWQKIVDDIKTIHETGRPVLVGTRTIEKSELLSKLLHGAQIKHEVLNAHHIAREADIVALAGQPNKVMVATNMAGRGTDVKLGEDVADWGGLHVICTELHDSARIDRQLAGRCGRQGDPGTTVQYMSLDDDVLRIAYGPKVAEKYKTRGLGTGGSFEHLGNMFRKAQQKVERRYLRDRMVLMHHEKQRKKIQRELGQDPYLDSPS